MTASQPLPHPGPSHHAAFTRAGVVLIVLACVAAEVIGGVVTVRSVREWYPTLAKPSWTPPDAVFGPVWTVLYAVMAVAASLVWVRRDTHDACGPMSLFAVQLAANVLWSVLFFGLRSPWLGLLDILLLWVAVGLTAASFFRVRPLAGWLLVPYALWVTFAAALNAAICVLAG